MSNTILTPTAVTRKALQILHQKLNFVGKVNRQYDSSYAKSGAKIGNDLKIRLPNQYTVRTGKTLQAQDTEESSVTMTLATQKGVDVTFSSEELTMELDDFSERILDPAMSVLAANIEADVMNVYKSVYNEISDVGATATAKMVLDVNKRLTDSLAPGSKRCFNMATQTNVDLIDALKGLFNPQANLSKNYKDGMVANKFLGFDTVYENTMWPIHTTGTDDGTGDYLVNDTGTIAEGSTSLTIDTGAGTWKEGDIFVLDDVKRVHPETKEVTANLQQFVVTADVSANATSISFSPALYSSGAKQNVNQMPANNAKLNKVESDESTAIGNAADYQINMGFHPNAFGFVTADLEMPSGVDFASRQVFDGISMRIVRAYDINNDMFPCRIDVLYGYKTLRPELACRLGIN